MRVLVESETVAEALQALLPAICAAGDWEVGAAWRVDPAAGVLRCDAFWRDPGVAAPEFEALSRRSTFAPGVGLPGRVWSTGTACRISDVIVDTNFPRAPVAKREGLHGALGFPIRIRGEVFGVLEFFTREVRTPSDELFLTMDTVGNQIGLFIHRARAQEAVRAGERRLKVLLGCTTGIIFEFDRESRYVHVWTGNEAFLARPPAELLGRTIEEVLGKEASSPFVERIARIHVTGKPETFEYSLDVIGGRLWFLADAFIAPAEGGGEPTVVFHVRDNTERKHAEQEQTRLHESLQALSRRLVVVQEAERRHIARELHDELGQILTGMKLRLETATRLPDAEAAARIPEALALVSTLIGHVRKLSVDLRPPLLDEGLLPALEWQVQHAQPIAVDFQHSGIEAQRFAAAVETAVFRIVQEALTNIARHAGVRDATVRLRCDAESISLSVEDDGVGFDLERVTLAHESGGLAGMRERATLLGGRLVIDSAPRQGTKVRAELPLSER
jgi:PAS domain S-box-containing protein